MARSCCKNQQALDQVSSDAESAEEQLRTTIAELEAAVSSGKEEGDRHS